MLRLLIALLILTPVSAHAARKKTTPQCRKALSAYIKETRKKGAEKAGLCDLREACVESCGEARCAKVGKLDAQACEDLKAEVAPPALPSAPAGQPAAKTAKPESADCRDAADSLKALAKSTSETMGPSGAISPMEQDLLCNMNIQCVAKCGAEKCLTLVPPTVQPKLKTCQPKAP